MSTLTTTTAVIRDDVFPVMLRAETAGGHFNSKSLNFVGEFLSFFQFGRSNGWHDQVGRVASLIVLCGQGSGLKRSGRTLEGRGIVLRLTTIGS